MANTEQHRGYIVDVDDDAFPHIVFDFYDPPSQTGGDAEWVETPIRLRSEPHQNYVQTSAIVWSIHGNIVASVETGDDRDGTSVERDISFLRSLQYPDYGVGGDDYVKPPHRIRLNLIDQIDIIGLLKNLQIAYRNILDKNQRPLIVEVTFDVVAVNKVPLGMQDVRSGRWLRTNYIGASVDDVI